jgi:phytoene synthase
LALTAAQRRFYIPDTLLDQLAYGTAMDLEDNVEGAPQERALRYRTFDDLYLYCYRVASVVGLVCIRIFGYQDPAAEPLAEKLGQAFQLTNIIRDIKEDAAVGRIYLPEEDFARFGISPYELHSPPNASRFAPLLEFEANRAREFYKAADALIPLIEEDSQPALWALVAIYRKLLEKIASRNFDVFHGRISLSTGEKLAILGKGILKRLA